MRRVSKISLYINLKHNLITSALRICHTMNPMNRIQWHRPVRAKQNCFAFVKIEQRSLALYVTTLFTKYFSQWARWKGTLQRNRISPAQRRFRGTKNISSLKNFTVILAKTVAILYYLFSRSLAQKLLLKIIFSTILGTKLSSYKMIIIAMSLLLLSYAPKTVLHLLILINKNPDFRFDFHSNSLYLNNFTCILAKNEWKNFTVFKINKIKSFLEFTQKMVFT